MFIKNKRITFFKDNNRTRIPALYRGKLYSTIDGPKVGTHKLNTLWLTKVSVEMRKGKAYH